MCIPNLPAIHVFHAHNDISLVEESPVEGHDVRRMTFVHNRQLAEDLFPHGRLRIDMNNLCTSTAIPSSIITGSPYLLRHNRPRGLMYNLTHLPTIPRAQILNKIQIRGPYIELKLHANLERGQLPAEVLLVSVDIICVPTGGLGVTSRGCGVLFLRRERESLEVLALEGFGGLGPTCVGHGAGSGEGSFSVEEKGGWSSGRG